MQDSSLLKSFDLLEVAEQRPNVLSAGERSRLAVARALASRAAVQVMDEPLAHVDSGRLHKYWQVIRDALLHDDSSLLFATHSPETVLREAEHVICLDRGTVVWQGPVLDLYEHPPDERVARFLGPANWFAREHSQTWLGNVALTSPCIRPERLQIVPDETGSCRVVRSRFAGSIAEVELVQPETQQAQVFYHRPIREQLAPGMPVSLRVLCATLLLICGLNFSGCRESNGSERPLSFEKIRRIQLPSEGAMLPAPRSVTFSPAGEMYVLDKAGRMLVYNSENALVKQWWMPEYSAGKPEGAWVMLDGRIAVADTHYHRVLFFDAEGKLTGTLGEQGEAPGQFIYTVKVTQDPHGFLYVAEYGGNDRVQKFTADGQYVLSIGKPGTGPGEFQRTSGIAWKEGKLYVADAINNRIHLFRDDGTFEKVIADAESSGLHYPYDLALAPDGTLWIAEYGSSRITQLTGDGQLLGHYGSAGRGDAQFWTPWGIGVSPIGKVVVADTGNRRLVELQP